MKLIAIATLIVFVNLVTCNPGRPSLPDNPSARKLFELAEQNRTQDGFITRDEMADIFEDFDVNMDGIVNRQEFMQVFEEKSLGDLASAQTLFHNADTDGDDVISQSPDLSRIFYYFDRNGDGKISQAEFVVVWISLSL